MAARTIAAPDAVTAFAVPGPGGFSRKPSVSSGPDALRVAPPDEPLGLLRISWISSTNPFSRRRASMYLCGKSSSMPDFGAATWKTLSNRGKGPYENQPSRTQPNGCTWTDAICSQARHLRDSRRKLVAYRLHFHFTVENRTVAEGSSVLDPVPLLGDMHQRVTAELQTPPPEKESITGERSRLGGYRGPLLFS